MKHWYVAQTHSKSEFKALEHILRQGFTAYLPRYMKRRRHARRTDWVPSPLFPSYLFVQLDLALDRWRVLQSTIGVAHLISSGSRLLALPEGVVEEIRDHEDQRGFVPTPATDRLKKGQQVKVTKGAFIGQMGLFDCATDDERIIILLDLLGRKSKVQLPANSVYAVS